MDYEAAGRLRDVIEQTTNVSFVIGRSADRDRELVQERYLIAWRVQRWLLFPRMEPEAFSTDYAVSIPTGCGTPGCWNRAPLAGEFVSKRAVVRL